MKDRLDSRSEEQRAFDHLAGATPGQQVSMATVFLALEHLGQSADPRTARVCRTAATLLHQLGVDMPDDLLDWDEAEVPVQ